MMKDNSKCGHKYVDQFEDSKNWANYFINYMVIIIGITLLHSLYISRYKIALNFLQKNQDVL